MFYGKNVKNLYVPYTIKTNVMHIRASKRIKVWIKSKKKYLFKLMNHAVFRITKENVRKHRDIKLIASDRNYLNYLVSESNYHTRKCFSDNLFPIEM